MKKFLAILLALVMCAGLVAACRRDNPPPPAGNGENGTVETPPPVIEKSERHKLADLYGLPYDIAMDDWEPITFTYFSAYPKEHPAEDSPIIAIVEKITNVKIDVQFHTGDDIETTIGTMLAVGRVPDMVYFGGEAVTAINSGFFMPVGYLVERYAPRLYAFYEPWWDLMQDANGDVYTLEISGTLTGAQNENVYRGTAFWIQKSVLDHFGRAPETLEEYFDFLRLYKELNPTVDGIPTLAYEVLTYGDGRSTIDKPGSFLGGYADWGAAINLDGSYQRAVISPFDRWVHEYNWEYYSKLNSEFHAGTFTAETLSRTEDEYLVAISTGAVLGFFDLYNDFYIPHSILRGANRWNRTYLPLALTLPGVEPNYMDARAFTGKNGINISSGISDPVRAIQYMDWIIHEDVQRFLEWGIEGEHYFYNSDGRIERSPEQRELQADAGWGYNHLGHMLKDLMPKMKGSFSDGNPTDPTQSPEEYFATLNEYDRALFVKLGIRNDAGLMLMVDEPKPRPLYYPFWSMDLEYGSSAELVSQRLAEINREYLPRLITAPEGMFDTIWEQYTEAILDIDQSPMLDFFTSEAAKRCDRSRR